METQEFVLRFMLLLYSQMLTVIYVISTMLVLWFGYNILTTPNNNNKIKKQSK